MKKEQYVAMVEGLISSVKEIFCLSGEDGLEAIDQIGQTITNLEMCWNPDGELSDVEWEAVFMETLVSIGAV